MSQTRAQPLGIEVIHFAEKKESEAFLKLLYYFVATQKTNKVQRSSKYLHLNVYVIHLMAFEIKVSVIHAI